MASDQPVGCSGPCWPLIWSSKNWASLSSIVRWSLEGKNRGSHSQDRRCFKKAKDRRLLLQRAERDVGTRVSSSKEFKLEN